jgi:hypothetical protein
MAQIGLRIADSEFPAIFVEIMKALLLLLLTCLPTLLFAQAANPAAATPLPANTAIPMWRCQLPGGTYEVALRSIIAVSSHEYLIDGGARVTEVNIDTSGSMLVRFYYIEPNTPSTPLSGLGAATIEKAQQILSSTQDNSSGQEVWQKVVKSYPTTTHAHTVEYRLSSKDQAQALFTSAETAFRTGRGSVYQASD